ncbi:MAG: hypothetical protein R2862_03355 [Thermoanaerobaculia bacterium]
MRESDGNALGFRELLLPMFFSCLGAAIVIWSVPGQGRTGFTALGMAIAMVGVAIARVRLRRKNEG